MLGRFDHFGDVDVFVNLTTATGSSVFGRFDIERRLVAMGYERRRVVNYRYYSGGGRPSFPVLSIFERESKDGESNDVKVQIILVEDVDLRTRVRNFDLACCGYALFLSPASIGGDSNDDDEDSLFWTECLCNHISSLSSMKDADEQATTTTTTTMQKGQEKKEIDVDETNEKYDIKVRRDNSGRITNRFAKYVKRNKLRSVKPLNFLDWTTTTTTTVASQKDAKKRESAEEEEEEEEAATIPVAICGKSCRRLVFDKNEMFFFQKYIYV